MLGRTGAGKSSLLLALVRLADEVGGTIHIDGVEMSKDVTLHTLRRRLALVREI